jgi:DNA repair protein RadC
MTSKLIQQNQPVERDALEEHFRMQLLPKKKECFMAVYLDAGRRVLACESLGDGTVNQAAVFPREVAAKALAWQAAGLVCAHNHPGGGASPSEADETLTRQLVHACCLLGVKLLDHLIVAPQRTFSFADQGLLTEYENEFNKLFT